MAKKQPQSFEQQMQRLQEIVDELEQADLPLEKNVALYKEGRELAASCKELLEKARHEIMLCGAQGEEIPFSAAGGGEYGPGADGTDEHIVAGEDQE